MFGRCDGCGTTILFGGKKSGARRYCGDACVRRGAQLDAALAIPPAVVLQRAIAVRNGLCPRCHGSGPIEAHVGHRVWSALVVTSWSSHTVVACRRCGVKSQLGSALFSLVCGWWGFPWGLLVTPVQVVRNLVAVLRYTETPEPSPELQQIVRNELAAQQVAQQSRAA